MDEPFEKPDPLNTAVMMLRLGGNLHDTMGKIVIHGAEARALLAEYDRLKRIERAVIGFEGKVIEVMAHTDGPKWTTYVHEFSGGPESRSHWSPVTIGIDTKILLSIHEALTGKRPEEDFASERSYTFDHRPAQAANARPRKRRQGGGRDQRDAPPDPDPTS